VTRAVPLATIFSWLASAGAHGDVWDPEGLLLCDEQVYYASPIVSLSDGEGGSYCVLHKREPDSLEYFLHLQRIDGLGSISPGWGACGTRLLHLEHHTVHSDPDMASDQAGGTYVTWQDGYAGSQGDGLLQRVTGAGDIAPGWPANGVDISGFAREYGPQLAPDGAGGVYVAYQPTGGGLYVQRINADGTYASGWPDLGVRIASLVTGHRGIEIVSDGSGGTVVVWADYRDYASTGLDAYAQRIMPDGAFAWETGGVPLCRASGDQPYLERIEVVTDGAGGALVAWVDDRDFPTRGLDVYGQHVTGPGSVAEGWNPDGNPICTAPGNQWMPSEFCLPMVGDGIGGVMVGWDDGRAGGDTETDIYAQRITGLGTIADGWPVDGLLISGAEGQQFGSRIAADGTGGALIAWHDYDAGMLCLTRVTGDGEFHADWPPGGVSFGQGSLQSIVSDGDEGAIVFWLSECSDSSLCNARALRLTGEGEVPIGVETRSRNRGAGLKMATAPIPTGRMATVNVSLSSPGELTVALFDSSGRRIRTLITGEPVRTLARVTWDGLDESGRAVACGRYFLRAESNGSSTTQAIAVIR
jgi:hypothetical protein